MAQQQKPTMTNWPHSKTQQKAETLDPQVKEFKFELNPHPNHSSSFWELLPFLNTQDNMAWPKLPENVDVLPHPVVQTTRKI